MFISRNVVIHAATVVLAELITYNRIFYNACGLLLEVEGPSSPPCQVWLP